MFLFDHYQTYVNYLWAVYFGPTA